MPEIPWSQGTKHSLLDEVKLAWSVELRKLTALIFNNAKTRIPREDFNAWKNQRQWNRNLTKWLDTITGVTSMGFKESKKQSVIINPGATISIR